MVVGWLPNATSNHPTRWLFSYTLTLVFLGFLAGCSGDSTPPESSPNEAESTGLTVTVESTPAPELTPTSTHEPQLDPIDVGGHQSFLDQIPEEERKCLLFSLDKDRASELVDRRVAATADEFQIIAGCLSSSTKLRTVTGLVRGQFSLGKESSLCFADRLATVDPTGAMIALRLVNVEVSQRRAKYDEAAILELEKAIGLAQFLCFDKEEWAKNFASILNLEGVDFGIFRCFLDQLGQDNIDALISVFQGNAPTLALFTASQTCGLDLERVLGTTERRVLTPTQPPVPTVQPTATVASPAPTAVPVATPMPTAEPTSTPTPVAQAQSTPTPAPPATVPTAVPTPPPDTLETLTIPWTVSGGVWTTNSYSGHVSLTISGTGVAAGDILNDAFYLVDHVHEGCETLFVTQVWLVGWSSPRPLANLIPDGCPEYSSDHTYQVVIDLGDYEGPLAFGTGDVSVGDNSGELTVSLSPTTAPEPTQQPPPIVRPEGTFLFDEVPVVAGRPPDMTSQLAYATPACPRDVPPLVLREHTDIDEKVDLDVLYIERQPVYGYRQAKTFPDVGEFVTYTAYVANRGSVDTSQSASEITVYWEMLSPSGGVLFEFTKSYDLSLPPNAVAEFKLGWYWEDGPNRLTFRVNPGESISEWTLVNNSVEIFTNALLVGLAFEESFYDWMSSVMNGELDVGRFYWFTRDPSSPPHRPEVFGAESWAQRHVEQMNEYFRKAEDDYFDGVRHSLPRVALQAVPVAADEEMGSNNSGLPTNGAWGDLDLVWGFQATFDQGHFPSDCRTPDPQGFWTWLGHYNPNFRTIEDPLIHELGHHMALRHEREIYGEYEFLPGTSPITLKDGSLAIQPPLEFFGDTDEVFGVMQNGDYSLGLSKYAAHTMAYRFQPIPGRDVPSRVGAINGGGGNGIPRRFGNYWDSYGTENVWDWVEYEQPHRASLTVADGDGNPVPNAEVKLYGLVPLPEEAMFPRGLPVPFSARWEGWFVPPADGSYRFLTYSLGTVRVSVDGQELVNPDGRDVSLREINPEPRIPGREFRHGVFWTDSVTLSAGQSYPVLLELDSFDVYGGQRFVVAYECLSCSPNPIGLREFQLEELWTVDRSNNGLDATFWDSPDYGADGSGPFIQRIVPTPKALPRGQMAFSEAPAISGTTSEDGTLVIDPTVLFPTGEGHRRTAVAVVRFGDQEFVRVLSHADMNLALWTASAEPVPTMKLDGTRDGFPTLLLAAAPPPT